ncbi:hypothetical protein [Pendulispora albinea]|uniref:Outer membrane protein beta-barrel domain-containing protein n=1 Tax=Pendulispora albinea TaxID=2741071 RepID=A0ABZ2M9B9_9BACT
MMRLRYFVALVLFAVIAIPTSASAAPPWARRRLTLPRHDWAFDLGMGVGHYDYGRDIDDTELGLDFELAVAPIRHLELGFRTGVRLTKSRVTHPDEFGRLYDRQTWGSNGAGYPEPGSRFFPVRPDAFANPEFRVRGQLVDTQVFELALEGRAYIPLEDRSRFTAVFGLPLGIHIGRVVRMDTGVYVPLRVYDPTEIYFSIPFDIWFQVTNRLWLGPLFQFKHRAEPEPASDFGVGFGLGYQFASWVDLKTQIFWPAVDNDRGATNVGAGVGVQLRIE